MKIKRMVKRLFAVGAGATMLGATAMGALAAADLSNYPGMVVDGTTLNAWIVVGENAKPVDNLAATDLAANMKVAKPAETTTTTTKVEGDAWLVGTSSKKFELANNNATTSSNQDGETIRDISTFIGDEELQALADGAWVTNAQSYSFQQFLFFDTPSTGGSACTGCSSIVKYTEDDGSITSDFFYIRNGNQIARYKLEFSSTAQSDVTDSAGTADSTGTYLDDFEDTKITVMGKPYSVVQARRPNTGTIGGQNSIKLMLMAGAVSGTLLEGESSDYKIGDKTYSVALTYVDDTSAKFTVNGEATNKLKDGDTFVLADKIEIGVSDVLYQSYAGGIHSASFFLGAQKVELRDDNVIDNQSSHALRIGSEDIDGTGVFIVGSDDNTTFTVSTIELNLTAEDDYYVGVNQKLSDVIAAAGEEKEVLFGNTWDIEYKGIAEQESHDIGLQTSSTRRYKLKLFDGDGKQVELPVAYAEGEFNLSLGEDTQANARGNDKRLILAERGLASTPGGIYNSTAGPKMVDNSTYKDDYFIVTGGTASDGSAKSYLLQYKGADRSTKTSPKIKFKNLGTGETLEYSVSTTNATATIKLGGYSFGVQATTDDATDDFRIRVDLDGDGTFGEAGRVAFVDYFGSQWEFEGNMSIDGQFSGTLATVNQSFLAVIGSVPNGDDFDNVPPNNIVLNITAASGPEVRAALDNNMTLLTPEGQTEVSYGYTSMGAFLKLNSPTGDPQEFTMTYPKEQRLPQLYLTSGATKTSTSASGGDEVAVTIGLATRLDSAVADAKAQNLIVVGGPCANTVAASLLGNPADCAAGFRPGVARLKVFEHANGNVALLVAGYSGQDTWLAGQFLATRAADVRAAGGTEAEIEGTTVADATIGAPAPVAAEPAAAEPVAEAPAAE